VGSGTIHDMARTGRPKRDDLALLNLAAEVWDDDEPEINFLARLHCLIGLPYRDPGDVPAWGRRNGNLSLLVQPGVQMAEDGTTSTVGYPYGTVPRLLLTWLSTEAVRTQSPNLVLGESLSAFMRSLGLQPTGGKQGTIARLRKQMERLFLATLTVKWEGDPSRQAASRLNVASSYDLWWSDPDPNDPKLLLPSMVRLSPDFFAEVIEHPVPLNLNALRALRGSALRIDQYQWLTYRMSWLKRRTEIPWESLRTQFGSNLADTRYGRSRFRQEFERNLQQVLLVYWDCRVETNAKGIVLYPSPTHVRMTVARRTLELG
jgi:hypothetical protein